MSQTVTRGTAGGGCREPAVASSHLQAAWPLLPQVHGVSRPEVRDPGTCLMAHPRSWDIASLRGT